ncbi:MAG: pyrroline-5-carboxylate reductase, partial [Gammaproteobacteria bacterium]|nr:pyrroline-5-carboxylate reductase [Gammaproteobacteria bacterium]
ANVSAAQREQISQIFNSVGQSCWIEDEANMDLVTAISGSGPAYFFYLAECMIDSAISQGLSREQAELLINQTALGAASMLKQSSKSATELREAVTSPGGTTAAALTHLQSANFNELVDGMITAAVTRGQQLAKDDC